MQGVFFICVGFLLGSVLFSYHVPLWIKHVDIVKLSPDHNPGTVNAIHLTNVPIGLLCLALDMLKGFLPVALAMRLMGPAHPLFPLVMLAPVLGHALAPWYSFPGGKAIATAFGVLAGLLPFSLAGFVLVFWYVFYSVVLVIQPHEKRSVVTFICFIFSCALGMIWTRHFTIAMGCLLLALVPMYKNYVDYRRMLRESQMESADGTDAFEGAANNELLRDKR